MVVSEVFIKGFSKSSKSKLPSRFYFRDTVQVAKDLLGKKLVRIYKGQRLAGLIVETEAYLGHKDAAAHSFGGRRTPRTEVMFGEGGIAYIYFVYGMHHCLNAVTRKKDEPEAVLIRALQCVEGVEHIKKWRQVKSEKDLANGPGKLCDAFKITKDLNTFPLDGDVLFVEDAGLTVRARDIVKRSRIGVDYAGAAAKWPLRFYIKGSKFISKV